MLQAMPQCFVSFRHCYISSTYFQLFLLTRFVIVLLACEWISLSITKTLQRIKYMDQNKIYRCRKYRNIYIVILYMYVCICRFGLVGIACTWDCLSNYIYLSVTVSMSRNIRFTTTCKHFLPSSYSFHSHVQKKKEKIGTEFIATAFYRNLIWIDCTLSIGLFWFVSPAFFCWALSISLSYMGWF